jgi:hypothetical protein
MPLLPANSSLHSVVVVVVVYFLPHEYSFVALRTDFTQMAAISTDTGHTKRDSEKSDVAMWRQQHCPRQVQRGRGSEGSPRSTRGAFVAHEMLYEEKSVRGVPSRCTSPTTCPCCRSIITRFLLTRGLCQEQGVGVRLAHAALDRHLHERYQG